MMQILHENLSSGELKIQLDCLDDLWVLYNILRPGDLIRGRTVRRVVLREGDTGTRRKMVLQIRIEKVEFHEFTNRLRALGAILDGPDDFISIGQHHTFNLEPGQKILIIKDKWYRNDIARIKRNLEKKRNSGLVAVAMESGLANVAILTDYSLTPVSEIKENIPGKRYSQQKQGDALRVFFGNIAQVVGENLAKHNYSLVIICGPGYIKERFMEYLTENASKDQNFPKDFTSRLLNASSGEISAIYEILRSGEMATVISDFKLTRDEMQMADFISQLGKNDRLTAYGIEQVNYCSQMGAIESLMITDKILRTSDKEIREKLEETMNNTEQNRGQVHIMNTQAPAGEQLERFAHIAAILRYQVDS